MYKVCCYEFVKPLSKVTLTLAFHNLDMIKPARELTAAVAAAISTCKEGMFRTTEPFCQNVTKFSVRIGTYLEFILYF